MAAPNTNRRSPRNPGSFLMGLAAVLFCLVAVSTYMMGGLYARYTTTGAGGDAARVASFDVSVDKPEDIEIQYGITQNNETDYSIVFHNDSEVAVEYSIVVVVNKAVDDTFDVKVALEGMALDTKADTTLDFGVVNSIPAGGDKTENLTFSVLDWAEFTKLGTGASRSSTLDFTVYITVTQVD